MDYNAKTQGYHITDILQFIDRVRSQQPPVVRLLNADWLSAAASVALYQYLKDAYQGKVVILESDRARVFPPLLEMVE